MPKPKPAHPPMRTRKKAKAATIRKRRTVGLTRNQIAAIDEGCERMCDQQVERPDTDDPSQMMAAEAACGPLVDPIIDEDEDDETPGFGDTP